MISRFVDWFLSRSKLERVLVTIDISLYFIFLIALDYMFSEVYL